MLLAFILAAAPTWTLKSATTPPIPDHLSCAIAALDCLRANVSETKKLVACVEQTRECSDDCREWYKRERATKGDSAALSGFVRHPACAPSVPASAPTSAPLMTLKATLKVRRAGSSLALEVSDLTTIAYLTLVIVAAGAKEPTWAFPDEQQRSPELQPARVQHHTVPLATTGPVEVVAFLSREPMTRGGATFAMMGYHGAAFVELAGVPFVRQRVD